MKTNPTSRRLELPLLGALLALVSAPLIAQQSAPPAATPPTASAPAAASTGGESTVTMDPFEVQESHDNSYGALNSNSITAFNTELDKMPVSADVFDQSFMNDTQFTTVEEMIDFYSAGSGTSATQSDLAAQNGQLGDRPSNGTISVRGLAAPTALVNGFFPVGTGGVTGGGQTSNFDLETVDVVMGPQALLYGVSGAGGAINFVTKQAQLGGAPPLLEEKFQVDQYGHKLAQMDVGEGTDNFAVRVALIDQTLGTRRVFIGGPMEGAYAQIAARPIQNTIIRVTVEKQTYDRVYQTYQPTTFTAASTSNDARNGDDLRYLLATNQLGAAAGGAPSGAGPIPGINWDNVDSLGGNLYQEYRDYDRSTATVDTTWTSWLTSQLAAGYSATTDSRYSDTNNIGYDAPNVSANPTGTFALVVSSTVAAVLLEPTTTKAARFSLLADNQLFDGKVDSKTVAGADTARTDGGTIETFYVQADSNFNIINTPGSSYNGATIIATQYFGIPNGPVPYPAFNPMQEKVTINGVNYVRAITNDTDAALISPGNPEGLTGTGKGDFRHSTDINSGYYAANYSDFLNGDVDTLLGARVGKAYFRNTVEGSSVTDPSILTEANANFVDLDAGVNVKVVGPLRAYAEVSESENPPSATAAGPLGEPLTVSKGLGEEVGLKASLAPWDLSAQLAFYHTNSKDEEVAFTSTLINDINPTGLNGQYNAPSNIVNVNRSTDGVSFTLTAAPSNWRLRISAAYNQATIGTTTSFGQVYNDQFYENAAGDVTYADGNVVYVPATFNSKSLTVSSTTSGAVPLTVTALSTPGGQYYTSPVAITGQIASSSNGYKVLDGGKDPANSGSGILTGALGLPISDYQLNTALTGVAPVGTVVLTQAGQSSTGVPKFALNFSAIYQFRDGPLQGLFLGPQGSISWESVLYYYFPQTVSGVGAPELPYTDPTEAVFFGELGYTRKFGRCTFTTQINCANVFNHYHVLILPSVIDGYQNVNLLTATFDQQPRMYVWTNTIQF